MNNKKVNSYLSKYGFKNSCIHYQLESSELDAICVEKKLGVHSDSGALVVNTGEFTGRSPKDRYIVKDLITKNKVWWGDINIVFEKNNFKKLFKKIVNHISKKEIYITDCFASADPKFRLRIRLVTEVPWVNIFAMNMFINVKQQELDSFSPDWLIIQAPSFMAIPKIDGTRSHNFSIINFSKKIIIIGGSGYTGEVKKGIFSVLNFIFPIYKSVLPMHCSASVGKNGDTAIFFGLSGTGKTTLSADPKRKLIGDDEHGWSNDNVIFNFEGGCYAKVINLEEKKEPEIFGAIKKGALLENVVFKNKTNSVNYMDSSITQNTRVSYPINHIKNIQKPSIGYKPKNIFFLTADAFGVLPPISKLLPNQAAYHFISGYTAKVAGTEDGVVEPIPSFSACFGAPFMPLHPTVYAEMLISKMKETNVNVWLINTGWSGGPYGIGKRIKLKYTRRMIEAALSGELGPYSYKHYHIHSVFGLAQPRECLGIPKSLLSPRATWKNDKAYYKMAFKLSNAFRENFDKFEDIANEEIKRGGPQRFSNKLFDFKQ
ncbi:MAG: phosphoenolpyruvate carboxykinase (ATP) [Flavobacteriaceae bacterium]